MFKCGASTARKGAAGVLLVAGLLWALPVGQVGAAAPVAGLSADSDAVGLEPVSQRGTLYTSPHARRGDPGRGSIFVTPEARPRTDRRPSDYYRPPPRNPQPFYHYRRDNAPLIDPQRQRDLNRR